MKYENIVEGIFLSRPNRFIAHVIVNGKEEIAHVKNTGRCKELLIPGVKVFLEENNSAARKTKYSLITVTKGNSLINLDSQAPNKILKEALESNIKLDGFNEQYSLIKGEKTYGSSRLDFYLEGENQKAYIEVKGVTLEENGIAKFPDAPTERGVKHINDLIKIRQGGFLSYIIFIIQMKGVKEFRPNDDTHKEFGNALREASKKGVYILAFDCIVGSDYVYSDKTVKIIL